MARLFNNAGEYVKHSIGAMNIAAPFTVCAILRRTLTSPNDYDDVVVSTTSADAFAGWDIGITPVGQGDKMYVYTAASVGREGGPALPGAVWACAGWSKASGTVNPTYHLYRYDTNAMSHATDTVGSLADGTAPGSGGFFRVGAFPGDTTNGTFGGSLLVVGLWDRVIANLEFESLPFTLMAWIAAAPKALMVYDQDAVTQKVPDLSGNGSNENARSGTSISTLSTPIFNYNDGIWMPTIVKPAAGGAAVTLQSLIAGTSAVTPALKENLAMQATIAGTSAVTPVLKESVSLRTSIAATSAVTAALKESLSMRTVIVGTSVVTVAVKSILALKTVVAGISSVAANLTGPAVVADVRNWALERRRRYQRWTRRIDV